MTRHRKTFIVGCVLQRRTQNTASLNDYIFKNAQYMGKEGEQMNTQELKAEIMRHGDTCQSLAEFMGISKPTFSHKINGKAEFTRSEIKAIVNRYNLSAQRMAEIFFTDYVS